MKTETMRYDVWTKMYHSFFVREMHGLLLIYSFSATDQDEVLQNSFFSLVSSSVGAKQIEEVWHAHMFIVIYFLFKTRLLADSFDVKFK